MSEFTGSAECEVARTERSIKASWQEAISGEKAVTASAPICRQYVSTIRSFIRVNLPVGYGSQRANGPHDDERSELKTPDVIRARFSVLILTQALAGQAALVQIVR